ncbi:calcium-activated chloride channel regulator 4-like [Ornithorhynchus anatinus]|uniref:calcium-activated chloride channel regulator 4-like n=1 Tax=Ornithorhynchus anatinus TaxID=9258 RepID=UPI0019D41B00|nr:calcium-activated chloride channel regulator 4-like [Ornithorhynchus anatinus]
MAKGLVYAIPNVQTQGTEILNVVLDLRQDPQEEEATQNGTLEGNRPKQDIQRIQGYPSSYRRMSRNREIKTKSPEEIFEGYEKQDFRQCSNPPKIWEIIAADKAARHTAVSTRAAPCSSDIEGEFVIQKCQGGSCIIKLCKTDQTGLFEKGCKFILAEFQTLTSSLMDMQSVESVTEFCTAQNHHAEAPNQQNRMCGHRSTWDVIRDSADFKNGKPMAGPPPKPVFSLLKSVLRRVCLVLDTSGSLAKRDRLKRMNQAVQFFLLQTIEEGGIFTTPSDAASVSGLIDAFSGLSSQSGNFSQRSTQSIQSAAQILTLTVTSPTSDPMVPPLTVTPRMNKDTEIFPSPMAVYAEVSQGFLPVLGAKVIAIIEPQRGKIVTLKLFDNGAGADVKANDGVYSRYFTAYKSNTRHSLKVLASKGKNRLSSSPQLSRAICIPGYVNPPKPEIRPEDIQSKVESFSRTALGSSFEISNVPSGPIPDNFAPCKITDLVAKTEGDEIHLTWTAPGGDYDEGQATGYIIKMSEKVLELRDRFDDALQVNTSTLKPKVAHSWENFVFRPENGTIANGTSIFVAVRAIDKVNQISEIFNIAQAALFIPPLDPNPADTGKKPIGVSTIVLAVTVSVVSLLLL